MDSDVIGQTGPDLYGGVYAATIKNDLKTIPTFSTLTSVVALKTYLEGYLSDLEDLNDETIGRAMHLASSGTRIARVERGSVPAGGETVQTIWPRYCLMPAVFDPAPAARCG